MLNERTHSNTIVERYDDILDTSHIVDIALEIDIYASRNQWLCCVHCINSGDTSYASRGLPPSDKGTVDQVIRYLYDPDSSIVLALSFEPYITQLTQKAYTYIRDEGIED